ncbi:MAG: hypothetical protein H7Z14_20830 [Anaerolineae bacterium]|nr:hypothetical protein [Phycisphaerae bacterium]
MKRKDIIVRDVIRHDVKLGFAIVGVFMFLVMVYIFFYARDGSIPDHAPANSNTPQYVRTDGDPLAYIAPHSRGGWGVVGDADKRLNDQAVKDGTRLLSAYMLRDSATRIWIITEADRSATTILLPDEY